MAQPQPDKSPKTIKIDDLPEKNKKELKKLAKTAKRNKVSKAISGNQI